jgi:hypothetical protein
MSNSATQRYLDHLFRDAGRVELRHHTGSQWLTTWHDEADELLAAARSKAKIGNLYTSLNHVCTRRAGPVSNDDIDRFTRVFFDLDPQRPAGTASTDWELDQARDRAQGLQRHLSGHGWPIPAIAISGNGSHLHYRCALPNTAEVREKLAVIYAGLNRRFGDDLVSFDRTVRNPGRICTLYGSIKRKGIATADRPHRQSSIIIPADWPQVHHRLIDKLADMYAKEPQQRWPQRPQEATGAVFSGRQGDYATLDVIGWFLAHGAYVRQIAGNVHGVRCPWSDEHTTPSPIDGGDTVIFEGDGSWPGFHCKHGHCEGRTIRDVLSIWPDADQFCDRAFVKSTGRNSSGEARHV